MLTEVSNEEELERAIALEAKVVGINTAICATCPLTLTVRVSWRRVWGLASR